jgi:hypothetical protein
MFPAFRQPVPVKVEYTTPTGQRGCRCFPNAPAARSFYVAQDKRGGQPKVIRDPAAGQVLGGPLPRSTS